MMKTKTSWIPVNWNTRRKKAQRKSVTIERNDATVNLDVVDTPGVTTEVNYEDFMEDMDKEDAVDRRRGATEGVAEAMHWLREDVDGVIYVIDSTKGSVHASEHDAGRDH